MFALTASPVPPRLPDHRVALLVALALAAVVGSAPRAQAEDQMLQPVPYAERSVVLRVDACDSPAAKNCWFVGQSRRPWSSPAACQARADIIAASQRQIRTLLKRQPPARRWALMRCLPLHNSPEA